MSDERSNQFAVKERRIRDAIRSIGDERADAAFRERLKRQFRDGTISQPTIRSEPSETRGLPRWAWFMVPAAAAAILVFIILLPTPAPMWTVYGQGQVEVDGKILSLDDPQLVASALRSGGDVRVPDESSLVLRFDDRLILALVEGTEATVPPSPGRGNDAPLVYEVREGELRAKTGPGFPGSALHVLTSESRTEIVGTIVSVYKGSGYTCVCVLEGTALIGLDEASLDEVPEGMLKIMFDDGSDPIVMEISPEHRAGLVEFSEQYGDIFESVTSGNSAEVK